MCLYPKLIINPKYKPNNKNGGVPPQPQDNRVKYVPIGCQRCMECRKQKARSWQVRLLEEIKTSTNAKFITLTFNTKSFQQLNSEIQSADGYERDNAIATLATRRFLERWRKKYKKSLKHWLVTELGQNGSERIHLHGIIWTDEPMETVEQIWQYGYMWKGKLKKINYGKTSRLHYTNYVNSKTITYVTKYVSKQDPKHKTYTSRILTSPGIGNNYTNRSDSKSNVFNHRNTNDTYRTTTGHKIALPIYWRNKIYTEQQREQLWLYKLDKEIRYVNKEPVSVKNGDLTKYNKLLKWHQARNIQLGYGTDEQNWSQAKYERDLRRILHKKLRPNTYALNNTNTSETLPTQHNSTKNRVGLNNYPHQYEMAN